MKTLRSSPRSSVLSGSDDDGVVGGDGFDDLGDVLKRRRKRKKGKWERKEWC